MGQLACSLNVPSALGDQLECRGQQQTSTQAAEVVSTAMPR